jgi:hypothetical protein
MIQRGRVFAWCDEAVAYEVVPRARWKRSFMLKRAMFRGMVSLQHPTTDARSVAKSLIAVPVYVALLPLAAARGQAWLMRCMVSLCDHLGRLLAVIGIRPIKEPYVVG